MLELILLEIYKLDNKNKLEERRKELRDEFIKEHVCD